MSPPIKAEPSKLRAAGLISALTLLSRVLGLVREQVFAALLGAGHYADAFNTAYRVPNLLRDLFAEGALSAAFIPTYARALHEGGPHAIGSFFEAGVIDELFLTISPLLVGRAMLDPRLALVESADLLPGRRMRLLGARRDTDHLFVRYEILAA